MISIINYVMDNPYWSAMLAGLTLVIVDVIVISIYDFRDKRKIYKYLLNSKKETEYQFRTTEAISSGTNISKYRVESLCSGHPKIKRNEKDKESWQLIL